LAGDLMVDRLTLNPRPDGYGFLYTSAWVNGEHVRIDILPPAHLWQGDVMLDNCKPDPKAWIVYMNGEQFARVERREDLPAVLGIEGPHRPRGFLSRVRVLLGRAVIIGALLVPSFACLAQDQKSPRSVVRVTAMDLFREYHSNALAVDERLKDKDIIVTGSVQNVKKNMWDGTPIYRCRRQSPRDRRT
jgi:hypothetical protein